MLYSVIHDIQFKYNFFLDYYLVGYNEQWLFPPMNEANRKRRRASLEYCRLKAVLPKINLALTCEFSHFFISNMLNCVAVHC